MSVEARAYLRPLSNLEWLGKLGGDSRARAANRRPAHHLWDHPGRRYLLDEILADVNAGHNIVATVFIQCASGYRAGGPEEVRPIGESEFVRAIADEADRRGTRTRMIVNAFDFYLAPLPPSSGELAGARWPYVETAIEAFGAERCMFESNSPVDKGACSYPVLVQRLQAAGERRLGIGEGRSFRRDRLALL